ncbi:TIGR03619 family F420-dependent LLM class oxidoreductase [Rhodococcus sp. IEGM 1379]|uniref:TIGR03619 family F420-dependent LLM class oxidoreductase n=1 Tax=Rhodococcus sp. IEGM 1379 TaxID=3047086 RepID=UPI0024B7EE0B|nr:TIGR03619 family F420-dependent LLM class oxidoreductase [Rhodococcus sp. IEGM 1379]MDI9916755.1 TIGR03619 family F420-dependent LLM class oxidoreductase [Rhodococcus sp. IEGM 1379]
MEIGVNVLGLEALFDGKIRLVLDFATRADQVGIDLICTGDHIGFNADAHAGRVDEHGFAFPLDHPWYEPISLLSSIAAVTERTRLGVSVLIATVRPPALLAKQVATLDALSDGRVTMGFGVGWQEAEYTATNMPFDARFGRMEETVEACRELWTQAPANFKGRDFSFENYHSLPLSTQDRVPVLFGFAPSQRNFDRIARVADGWTVNPTDLPTFTDSVALLRNTFEAHGRDPQSVRIQVSAAPVRRDNGTIDLAATAERAHDLSDRGASVVVFRPAVFDCAAQELPELLNWMSNIKEA